MKSSERSKLSSFINNPLRANTTPAKTITKRDTILAIKGKMRYNIVLSSFYLCLRFRYFNIIIIFYVFDFHD